MDRSSQISEHRDLEHRPYSISEISACDSAILRERISHSRPLGRYQSARSLPENDAMDYRPATDNEIAITRDLEAQSCLWLYGVTQLKITQSLFLSHTRTKVRCMAFLMMRRGSRRFSPQKNALATIRRFLSPFGNRRDICLTNDSIS